MMNGVRFISDRLRFLNCGLLWLNGFQRQLFKQSGRAFAGHSGFDLEGSMVSLIKFGSDEYLFHKLGAYTLAGV